MQVKVHDGTDGPGWVGVRGDKDLARNQFVAATWDEGMTKWKEDRYPPLPAHVRAGRAGAGSFHRRRGIKVAHRQACRPPSLICTSPVRFLEAENVASKQAFLEHCFFAAVGGRAADGGSSCRRRLNPFPAHESGR